MYKIEEGVPRKTLNPEEIQDLLDARNFKAIRQSFRDFEVADIAAALDELDVDYSIALFRLVPRKRRVQLFAHLELERQKDLVEELPDVIVSSILNEMDPDDRTRLLEDLRQETRDELLLSLDPEERRVAWKLLSYPEDSVGRLMTPDFMTLSHDMAVQQALSLIRWNAKVDAELLSYLFVVDDAGVLIGEVSLASLVICDPQTLPLQQVMNKNYVYLYPHQEGEEAVETFRKYDRPSIPVVDEDKKMLGIVTADDLFDVAEEEATEDIQQFGGHGALEDSYFHTPLLTMLKKRSGWLIFLFVTGFFSCGALHRFEDTLAKWSFVMFFLPIITSSGGNSGTQAASLIIRGLAINEMTMSDALKVLRREVVFGFLLGCLLACIGFLGAAQWGVGIKMGWIIALSVTSVVICGVIIGSMLPFLFKFIKLDPAVVSSPFISTLMDVTGIFTYMNITLLVMNWNS